MKHFILLSISVLLIACSDNTNKSEELKARNYVDSLYQADLKMKLYLDSIDSSVHYPSFMYSGEQKNNYFSAFCPSDTINGIPMSSILRKGANHPFDTSIVRIKDSVFYSFKVSNTCCGEYFGGSETIKDSLILYYSDGGGNCDCDCDYILTYKFHKRDFKKKIRIALFNKDTNH